MAFGPVVNVAKHVMDAKLLHWIGACDAEEFLDGLYYERVGKTKSGASFYRAFSVEEFLYYDPSCDGVNRGRWIVGPVKPDVMLTQNLTGLGCFGHHAHLEGDLNGDRPPEEAQWYENCGRFGNASDWRLKWVSLHMVTRESVCSCKPCCVNTDAESGCCDGADYARCCEYSTAGFGKVALNTTAAPTTPTALSTSPAKQQATINAAWGRLPCWELPLLLLLFLVVG